VLLCVPRKALPPRSPQAAFWPEVPIDACPTVLWDLEMGLRWLWDPTNTAGWEPCCLAQGLKDAGDKHL